MPLVEHAGDRVPFKVKFAHFIATPFLGVAIGLCKLLRVEVMCSFGPSGMAERDAQDRSDFLTLGAMAVQYGSDVVIITDDWDEREAGYLRPEIHGAMMRASERFRKNEAVLDFLKAHGFSLEPTSRYRTHLRRPDSFNDNESQPKGYK